MKLKETVLYIFPGKASFIEKDIEFLSKTFRVLAPAHFWYKKLFIPVTIIQQFLFLSRNIWAAKTILVRFGGYWAFLPALFGKLFGKPVFIILGGTDCVSFPSLNYGSLRKPLLKKVIHWSYKLCTRLLPVHESLVFSNYNYYENSDYKHQGFKFFFPKLSKEFTVIHNGFDPELYLPDDFQKKHNSFITVASIPDMERFYLKGIDRVIELARVNNNCVFHIIGFSKKLLAGMDRVPPNVTLYPMLSAEEVIPYLAQSEFYLQLSISEGFPNSLCEGMLCGCIPIGSSVGGTPFIIDDAGFIMETSNLEYLKTRFDEILNLEATARAELSAKVRQRIIDNFHIERREGLLLEVIEKFS